MARSIILWIIAAFITLGSAQYQRKTGPTYPVEGITEFAGAMVEYSLTRTHGGEGDQKVPIIAPSAKISGRIIYKRYKTDDPWRSVPLIREGDRLTGYLPHQPPAGKLEYYVELSTAGKTVLLPHETTVVTRFKGAVPDIYLIPHVILMFLAMLISTRAGLEAFFREGRCRTYAFWTFGLLVAGGLIFGPIVQKFAFGEYWTGFPFGMDLTDNKTLIAFIAWLIAIITVGKKSHAVEKPGRRWFVLAASIIMLAVYLIPHSLMGSELDYKKLDREQKVIQTEQEESN